MDTKITLTAIILFQFCEMFLTFLYIVMIMEKEDPRNWKTFWVVAAKRYVQDLFKGKRLLEKAHSVLVLFLSIPALLFAIACQAAISLIYILSSILPKSKNRNIK